MITKDWDIVETMVNYHCNPDEQNEEVLLKYYRDKLRKYYSIWTPRIHPQKQTMTDLYKKIMTPNWKLDIDVILKAFELAAEIMSYQSFPTVKNHRATRQNIYPLLNDNGLHCYDSYLYALVHGIHLAGFPYHIRSYYREREIIENSSRKFYKHDLIHIEEMEDMGIMRPDNLKIIEKINHAILVSDLENKKMFIYLLWTICHELCWDIEHFKNRMEKNMAKTLYKMTTSTVDHDYGFEPCNTFARDESACAYLEKFASDNPELDIMTFLKYQGYCPNVGPKDECTNCRCLYYVNFIHGLQVLYEQFCSYV